METVLEMTLDALYLFVKLTILKVHVYMCLCVCVCVCVCVHVLKLFLSKDLFCEEKEHAVSDYSRSKIGSREMLIGINWTII